MRRVLSLLAIAAALALPVAVFTAPASAATQPHCWGDSVSHDGVNFAGWASSSTLGAGHTASANITDYGNAVEPGTTGNVRGEVVVTDNVVPQTDTNANFIKAGVVTTTSGDRLFIEYKNAGLGTSAVYTDEGAASVGTTYAASIKYNGSNSYTATINGHSLTVTLTLGFPMFGPGVVLESQQKPAGGLCNTANMDFTSVSSGIVGSQKWETDTSEITFALYPPVGQSFIAYSPWVGSGCGGGGPCT